MVRDMSKFALQLYSQPIEHGEADGVLPADDPQKAVHDPARYERVWREHVAPLDGAYEMNE